MELFFAINHGIKVEDIVVFQLVIQQNYKVCISRVANFSTTDEALDLLCLDADQEKKIAKGSSDAVYSKEDPWGTQV